MMTRMAATTKYWAVSHDSRDFHFVFGCYFCCVLADFGGGGIMISALFAGLDR